MTRNARHPGRLVSREGLSGAPSPRPPWGTPPTLKYRFQLSLILARDGLEAMERPEFARALQLLETALPPG
ncbi:hypothetical protein ACN28S_17325 [Cystobacter fuscus]